MDRSSFRFAGSTNDLEKRLAYKAKLASKIEPPKSKELPALDNTFNGVVPGGKLVHPNLGEGTLIEVNHLSNEVLIDFGSLGLIGLVMSQAKSFVHAPVKAEESGIAGKDDAFLGAEIQTRMLAPQDRDSREVDFSRIVSPDFIEPKKQFAPVGSRVWHPDLGACTVSAVDESANSLSLDTPLNGRVDMVLSQVRTKLREIDTLPDHVPVKPLVREPLAERVTQYTSRSEVSVSIPEVFKTWQRQQQFMFLTRSQHLTTEQANDVFAVLEGDKPLFHKVNLTWQTKEETEANIIPGPEALSSKDDLIDPYASILYHKKLWHPDFGECSVSSVDEKKNELVLQTSVGLMPFIMDATVPKLAVLTASVEHAPKRLGTRVFVTSDTSVADRPKVSVSIPEAFVTWRPIEQYQYLTVSCKLAPENANELIATMAGTLHSSKTEYEIFWTGDLPETNKRAEFKDQLLKRIEAASVEQELPAPPAPVDPGITRVVEEIVEIKKTPVLKSVAVDLPADFKAWTASGQYVFLTRTKHMTSTEANDVLDLLQGKRINSKIQYDINWSE